MRQLTYIMHFRGQASFSAEDKKVLRMTGSATSSTIETIVKLEGVETALHPADGDMAFLEAEVRLTAQDAFEGQGILTFGEEGQHELRFSTVHAGHLGPSPLSGMMAGSVTWRVQGGTGRFQSATGLITSTFTLNEAGELSEYQCGLIFVAD